MPSQADASDPPPVWHQFAELPKVSAVVTEFQGHARACPDCGHITREPIPAEIRAHAFGPRLAAVLSYLSGSHYVSQPGLEDVAQVVFGVPVSLGSMTTLQEQMSQALVPACEEIAAAVRPAPVKNVDETGWKQAGGKRWLWAAVTASAALFVIHLRRSAAGLKALLGEAVQGLITSDRWSAYQLIPVARRQVCWAHLKRDFQKIVDRGGPSQAVGRAGLGIIKKVFAAWQAFQDGQVTRAQLQAQLDPVICRLNRVLLEGALLGTDRTVAQFCDNVLAVEPALWTFVSTEGVEPTNNFMERLLRRAVLWRKRSFGCWSKEGCRFVERILTVVQTRRLQGQNVLGYLHDAILAHRTGQPCPRLLPVS